MNITAAILRVNLLFFLLVGVNSCKGQDKDKLKKDSVFIAKINTENSATIKRKQGVVSGNFSCVLQDKSGKIWFGSGGEVVLMYNRTPFQMTEQANTY